MTKLAENPPVEFCAYNATGLTEVDWSQTWRVAYTKPRQEKKLAHDLIARNVSYFLPMVLRETFSGGRRRRNMYPLFASYLFFPGGDQQRLACLKTERVVHMLEPEGDEQLRLREELRSLATLLATDPAELELYRTCTPGKRVRVTAGPQRGVEGTIIESGTKYRLQVAVSLLGLGVVVETQPDQVELL